MKLFKLLVVSAIILFISSHVNAAVIDDGKQTAFKQIYFGAA